jgi:HPt (histidine-containing phosphotransfer) domain-containing protein
VQGVTATGPRAPGGAIGGGSEAVFDAVHLDSQTLGDDILKRDVLELFLMQCSKLLPVIAAEGVATRRLDAAHTLKGAAWAVGAWAVAARAGAVERAACEPAAWNASEAVGALAAAVAEARQAIERMLDQMTASQSAQSAA